MSRRRGKAAAGGTAASSRPCRRLGAVLALAISATAGVGPLASGRAGGADAFERRAWPIMGTFLEVAVHRAPGEEARVSRDLRAAYEEVVRVDRLMSLYRDDSELSRLNRRAGEEPLEVGPDLRAVLRAARHYGDVTEGALDVTVQPLIDLWGFYFEGGEGVPSPERIEAALRRVDYRRVHLHPDEGAVSLEAGVRVDLGAIAKGYAVDLAVAALRRRGVVAATVDLGGNVGVLGSAPGRPDWPLGVRHPREPGRILGTLRIAAGAVATSGDYERFFVHEGRRYAHIVDPRSGWPVEGIVGVTVAAPDGTAADALTTGAFVMGPEAGLELLARCRGVEGLVVIPRKASPGSTSDGGATGRPGETEPGPGGSGAEHGGIEGVEVLLTPGLAGGGLPRFEAEPGTTVRTPAEVEADEGHRGRSCVEPAPG